ncbi:MAG: CotH kinase family protein, partial [Verrucomicrobiota bacterium]
MDKSRLLLPLLLVGLATAYAQNLPPLIVPKPTAVNVAPDALFAGVVPRLELTISPENIDKLAKNPRDYVTLTIKEAGGVTLEKCSVKLKGSAGSFRQIADDRPGFSLRTAKSKKGQEFRGLSKFQLNNCAQDGTMLLEMVAGEMARRAGVPASRCTHAYVTLNGKALGTYVLKEGFNEEFLGYFFKDTTGHLYDGGFCQPVGLGLEVDQGDPDEKVRLTELVGAAAEGNPALRRARVERILDVDAYYRHLAVEQILCHWDGYSFNHNNYRLYEDPRGGRFHFILHGMDQVFGDERWYVLRRPNVDQFGLFHEPAQRERYRAQFFAVYDKHVRGTDWARRALELAANAKAKLAPVDGEEARRFEQRGKDAAAQVKRRLDAVRAQVDDVAQLRALGGRATLAKYAWGRSTDKGDAEEKDHDGRPCFALKVGAEKGGDFRLELATGPGRYRLTGLVKTADVVAGKEDREKGLRFRLSGQTGAPALT